MCPVVCRGFLLSIFGIHNPTKSDVYAVSDAAADAASADDAVNAIADVDENA